MSKFYEDAGIWTTEDESVSDTDADPGRSPSNIAEPGTEPSSVSDATGAQGSPPENPAIARFQSCRWHETQDGDLPDYCSNRDVLPFAGKNGFNAEAWCPDCDLYKVKRTVKKRRHDDWDDY